MKPFNRAVMAGCGILLFATQGLAQQRVRVLVAYHSVTGNTEAMARAAAEGARGADAAVELKKIADVTRADLEQTDALIIGSPTQWSNMTSAMKAFIETWPDMVDKIGGAFATGGAPSGGKEHVVTSLVSAMLSHGMVVAGPVYAEGTFRFGASGATATTGPGHEGVGEAELNEARALGQRIAQLARSQSVRAGAAATRVPADAEQRAHGQAGVSEGLCALGHEQSPIDLGDAVTTDLPPLQFHYHVAHADVVDLQHAIQATFKDSVGLRIGDVDYRLLQFHYHHPSEHTIDGRATPLEVHLVHADAHGKLAVVGVRFVEGPGVNPALARMLQELGGTGLIDPEALLPANRGYFTYAGSLTTAPCSEGVRWVVLKEPMTETREQIEALRREIEPNARPVQKLEKRTVRQTSGK